MTDTPAAAPGRSGPPSAADAPAASPQNKPRFGDWRARPEGAGDDRTLGPPDRGQGGGARPPGRFAHPWRWVAGVLGALILLLILFLWLFNWDWLRGPIARYASAQTHRSVRIDGHLRVHLLTWTPTVRVEGIKVGQPDWAAQDGLSGDMTQVESVTASVKLLGLLRGHIDVPLFDIERPNVVLYQDAQGRANWDFSDPNKTTTGKPLKLPPIEKFVIADGHLSMTDVKKKLRFSGTINTTERASSSNAESFRLSGAGTLNAKPFQMNIAGGPLINIHRDQPYPFDADVRAGATHLTAHGNVPHPFDLGRLDMRLAVSGADLNDLYYLTGLALPNTPPYQVSGRLVRNEKVFDFQDASGRIGGSDIEGRLSVDTTHKRPYLRAALASRLLDFKDLASLFGAPGASKAATPAQKAQTAATTGGNSRLLPDATLQADRLRAMNADVTYHAASVKAPNLPLEKVSLGLKLDDGVLTLNPIRFGFPQGSLNGNARLDGRPANPVTDVDLRLSNVQLGNFIPAKAGGPKPLEGELVARAKLHGVGDSVHKAASTADGQVTAYIPHGQMRQAFAELLGVDAGKGLYQLLSKDQHQTDLRCAVADFRVRNGVLQAERITIDTTVVVVQGQGSINLGDETMALQFTGKPTHFRLFHVFAPITIGGHLKSPAFGVKPGGAIAQVGVAVAAGALLTPLAAVIPFLDLGGAKNADCGQVAAEAKSGPAPVPTAKRTAHPGERSGPHRSAR